MCVVWFCAAHGIGGQSFSSLLNSSMCTTTRCVSSSLVLTGGPLPKAVVVARKREDGAVTVLKRQGETGGVADHMCQGVTAKGRPCKRSTPPGQEWCRHHAREPGGREQATPLAPANAEAVAPANAEAVASVNAEAVARAATVKAEADAYAARTRAEDAAFSEFQSVNSAWWPAFERRVMDLCEESIRELVPALVSEAVHDQRW